MADNISVKVTADTVSLNAELAKARAELGAFSNQLNSTAREITKLGGATPELNSKMQALSEGTLNAKAKVADFEGQLRKAQETSGGLHGSVSSLTREFRALFDEVSAGRTRMIPGTLAQLANVGLGIQGATLAAGVGVAALAAGIGYLVYQTIEARKQAAGLAMDFALTGRGATDTKEAVQGEIEALNQLPGVTNAIAKSVVEWEAAHGEIDDRINALVNELLPALAIAGVGDTDKVTEAQGRLKETMQSIAAGDVPQAVAAFTELTKTHQELRGAEAIQIQTLIESGHQLDAVKRILATLATEGHESQQSLGNDIANTKKQLDEARDAAMRLAEAASQPLDPQALDGIRYAAKEATDQVVLLEQRLHQLQTAQAMPVKNLISTSQVEEALERIKNDTTKTTAQIAQTTVDALNGVLKSENLIGKARLDVEKMLGQAKVDLTRKTSSDIIENTRETTAQLGLIGAARLKKEISDDRALLANAHITAEEKVGIGRDLGEKLSALNQKAFSEENKDNRKAVEAARAAAHEKEAIARSNTDTELELSKIALQEKKALLQQEVEAGHISKDDELRALQDFARVEQTLNIDALTADEAANDFSLENFTQNENKKKIERAKLAAYLAETDQQILASDIKTANSSEKAWEKAQNSILEGEKTFIGAMFSGNTTLLGALSQALIAFGEREVENIAEDATRILLIKQTQATGEVAIEQKSLLFSLLGIGKKTAAEVASTHLQTGTVVAGQTAQTSAVIAGQAAQTSAIITGKATAGAAAVAMDSAQIMNDAYKAASGAYSAVAGIPYIGPILAPIAAGVSFAAVAAFDSLTSFDVGTNYVPNNMVAQIHQGERIIPAADNRDLMNSMNNGTGGGSDIHLHYAPTIQGVPIPNMKKMLDEGGYDLLDYLGRMARRGTLQNYIG
jgi:hypothetical protein